MENNISIVDLFNNQNKARVGLLQGEAYVVRFSGKMVVFKGISNSYNIEKCCPNNMCIEENIRNEIASLGKEAYIYDDNAILAIMRHIYVLITGSGYSRINKKYTVISDIQFSNGHLKIAIKKIDI